MANNPHGRRVYVKKIGSTIFITYIFVALPALRCASGAHRKWSRLCLCCTLQSGLYRAVILHVDSNCCLSALLCSRCQNKLVCSGVQSAGNGVCLTQPHPETDVIPCEMTFMAHPVASEFCITKIIIVSEARNLEMYVNNMYEKTAKGLMLTLRKGKWVFFVTSSLKPGRKLGIL